MNNFKLIKDFIKESIDHQKLYIRWGNIPKEKSRVSDRYRNIVHAKTGFEPDEFEKGVSVFPTTWSTTLKRWYVPSENTQWNSSLDELYNSSRPIFLLTGNEINEGGSDGEPLLDRDGIKTIKKLTKKDLFVETQEESQLAVKYVLSFLSLEEKNEYLKLNIEINELLKKRENNSADSYDDRLKLSGKIIRKENSLNRLFFKGYQNLMNLVKGEINED